MLSWLIKIDMNIYDNDYDAVLMVPFSFFGSNVYMCGYHLSHKTKIKHSDSKNWSVFGIKQRNIACTYRVT